MNERKELMRPYFMGETVPPRWIYLPVCKCKDKQRGPKGGVCGNCAGAIPDDKGR
jgi:hypothetical protein